MGRTSVASIFSDEVDEGGFWTLSLIDFRICGHASCSFVSLYCQFNSLSLITDVVVLHIAGFCEDSQDSVDVAVS